MAQHGTAMHRTAMHRTAKTVEVFDRLSTLRSVHSGGNIERAKSSARQSRAMQCTARQSTAEQGNAVEEFDRLSILRSVHSGGNIERAKCKAPQSRAPQCRALQCKAMHGNDRWSFQPSLHSQECSFDRKHWNPVNARHRIAEQSTAMQSTAMQGNATQRPLEFSAVAAFERELLRAETSERAKGIAAQRNAMHGKAKQGTAKQRTTLINHLESTMEHDDIITQLIEHDYFTYGATIKPVDLLAHFGLAATTDEEMAGWSLDAIRGRIQKDSLMEVSIASKVRDRLLDQGRYLGGVKGEYRVFLPSENARVADNYLDRSTSAQRRAHRLRASTPHASIEFSSSNGRAAITAARNERQAKKKV